VLQAALQLAVGSSVADVSYGLCEDPHYHIGLGSPKEGIFGLLNFDPAFEFGSLRADQLVKGAGRQKVLVPTVPASGNGLLRSLLEAGTGVNSAACYPEGGRFDKSLSAYVNDHPCGWQNARIGPCHNRSGKGQNERCAKKDRAGETCEKWTCETVGNLTCSKEDELMSTGFADDTRRAPSIALHDAAVIKSHYPFHRCQHHDDYKDSSFVILVTRHPVVQFSKAAPYEVVDFLTLTAEQKVDAFHHYMDKWYLHHAYWERRVSVPTFRFRYEDLLREPHRVIADLTRVVPSFGFHLDTRKMHNFSVKPVRDYSHSKCRSYVRRGNAYANMNQTHLALMRDYGYHGEPKQGAPPARPIESTADFYNRSKWTTPVPQGCLVPGCDFWEMEGIERMERRREERWERK
jgi:hypothetical protein